MSFLFLCLRHYWLKWASFNFIFTLPLQFVRQLVTQAPKTIWNMWCSVWMCTDFYKAPLKVHNFLSLGVEWCHNFPPVCYDRSLPWCLSQDLSQWTAWKTKKEHMLVRKKYLVRYWLMFVTLNTCTKPALGSGSKHYSSKDTEAGSSANSLWCDIKFCF